MAHIALLWKARVIEKYRLNYEKEKQNSIKLMNTQNSQRDTKTLYQKFCSYNLNTKKIISNTVLRCCPKGSAVYNLFYYLKTDQTFPNFLMKSVIGFVGGIILTYLCFMFFVFQLSISLIHATIMSSIIGILLTLGLAFSYRIRCLVFLLIPQFFSRVGRYTLTCYALVLILTGPATNTLKNSEVLSESLACAEEQVKTNMYQINESIRKPSNCLKDSIGPMVAGLKQLAAKIKKTVMRLHRLTLSVADSLQSSVNWLNSVADYCTSKFGTPYARCVQAIQQSTTDCRAVIGPWYSSLCDAQRLTQVACWPVQSLPAFCHSDFANENLLGVVTQKLKTFTERINSMLYLEVHVHHSYSFRNHSSHTDSQVAAGIVTEIRNKADLMLTWLSWSSCVTSLSLLLIIFRAKHYQHMYETRSRFDNRYVTKELIDLDLKRLRHGKETVLPLNKREEGKYIKTTSFRLVSSEKVHLSRSAVTMAITTFKLLIHMVADYSLYWVLMTIRHHGLRQTPLKPGTPNAGVHVSGSTLISNVLASVVEAITLPLATPPASTMTCLPNPHPPDFQRYLQIGILIFLLWFFAMFEPYGLRLRHIIMGLYRPERAKARAVWLLNHIQRTRGSFLKFARRKLHREFKYSTESRHTFRSWIQDHIPCKPLRNFLEIYPEDLHCVLCGVIEACNECDGTLVWCNTPGCPGIFCTKCFSDIGELCTICLTPADYGDFSDVSLAKGSSEESDDEDLKCSSQCCERYSAQHKKDDDDNAGPSKNQPQNYNMRWSLFRTNNKNKPEEYPLLEREEHDEEQETTERKLSKAMMVRHQRYTDFDLQNERQKVIVFLGEDTVFSICHNHCKQCAVNRPVNNKTKMVHKDMQHASRDKTNEIKQHYDAKYSYSNNQYNKFDHIPSIEMESKKSKRGSSINALLTKLRHLFKRMRKYSLSKKHSPPFVKIRRRRKLVLKICSLKFRRTSRKRKRRLQSQSKLKSFIFNRIIVSSAQKKYMHKKIARQFRLKKTKRRIRMNGFGHKIINLLHNIQCISSTVVECEKSVDKCSDIDFEFNEIEKSDIATHMPTDFSNGKYISVAGGRNLQTDKNVVQKEEPLKIKDNKEENYPPKITENKQFDSKREKYYKICGSCMKMGIIFSSLVKCFNYLWNDRVSELVDTTNHKKRKKRESPEEINPRIIKKDNEATRKYRILTFLSEQDWMKERCTELKSKITEDVKDEFVKELFAAGREETKTACNKTVMADSKAAVCGKCDKKGYKKQAKEINRNKVNANINLSESREEYKKKDKKCFIEPCNSCKERNYDNPIKCENKYTQDKYVYEGLKKKRKKEHAVPRIKLHVNSADEKKRKQNRQESCEEDYIFKNDAEIGVKPVVQNNDCQYSHEFASRQSEIMYRDLLKKVRRLLIRTDNCIKPIEPAMQNSATQHSYSCRNVAIYSKRPKKRKRIKNASTLYKAPQNTAVQCKLYSPLRYKEKCTNATELVHDFNIADVPVFDTRRRKKTKLYYEDVKKIAKKPHSPKINKADKNVGTEAIRQHSTTETTKTTSSLGILQSISSIDGISESYSEESKSESEGDEDKMTDTTVYTVSNVGYDKPPRRKKGTRVKLTVITKANRSTATESTKCCDVSTVTSDWWSPILERKNKRFNLGKNEVQVTPKKVYQDKGVETIGKIVTFNSIAKIIPSMRTHLNLMSASRYLLESQKYYNEIFSTDRPFTSDLDERYLEEPRYSSTHRHVLKNKGLKAEQEESYTKFRPFMEQVWAAEALQRNPSMTVHRRNNRALVTRSKEGLTKGVKKVKHVQRHHGVRKPELKIKSGVVNMHTRRYLSTENISLDNIYNSLTETGSF